jgi:transposase InsO family protein
MTAMQIQPANPAPPPLAPPAPQDGDWLDLPTASRRAGCSEGHLRRTCGQKWMALGLARQTRPADGGALRWEVHESADPLLSRVKSIDTLDDQFDIRTLSDDQRRQLLDRKRLLDAWLAARANGVAMGFPEQQATEQFIARLLCDESRKLSRATLFNWHSAHRRSGLAGLVDERWKSAQPPTPTSEDPFYAELQRHYLNKSRPLSKQLCYEIALTIAAERGWTVPSYRTACRFLDRIPRAVTLKYRKGDKAYTDHAEPFIQRDYSTLASNELWNSDHHECDVIVRCGTAPDGKPIHRRPWLTAWQDCRSRKIVGYCIRQVDPNTDSILIALRLAIKSHGVPQTAHVDNGKDFDSFAMHGRTKRQRWQRDIDPQRIDGAFIALGIEAHNVQPYHGQSKPIERFFGTLEDRFGKTFATYCGPSPDKKPEGLNDRVARGEAPSLEEFIAAFADWLETDYHQRPHSGDAMDGQSPASVWQAQLQAKRTAPDALLDVLTLIQTPPVKVQQNGVTLKGILYGSGLPELIPLLGEKVTLRYDPDDVSSVLIFTAAGKFICRAEANRKLPANASAEDLREAIRGKRRHRKLMNDFHEQRPRLAEDSTDRVIRAAAQRNRQQDARAGAQGDPDPAPLRPIQSPFADQLPALQKALNTAPARMAAGAESMSLGQMASAFRAASAGEVDRVDPMAQLARAFRSEDDDA